PGEQATEPPENWQKDELTQFMQKAHWNRWATFVHQPEMCNRLIRIDACFIKVAKALAYAKNIVASQLSIRAHVTFRTSCGLAMASQGAETFVMLRACLENAAYALHAAKTPGADRIWLNRHKDNTSRGRM